MKNSKYDSRGLWPYLWIAIAAILAYLPVSSMLFTLKNDVMAIEYPVQHFISEALRNGENPVWFNTWCMGFPLHSVLTWGIYSTPTVVTGTLFPSDITTFHIQFLAYVIAAGWAMYRLLNKHFLPDRQLSFLLACCYMLSGFTVASSQWLLYITGMAFIPFLLHCTISLFRDPCIKNSFLVGIASFLLLTNTHIYLTVFSTLFLSVAVILYLLRQLFNTQTGRSEKSKLLRFTAMAVFFSLLFCAAPLYYTIETVSFLERSNPLNEDLVFSRSNYLHPEGLKSLFLPLSVIRSVHFNTEPSIQNIYTGLLPLALLLPTLLINFKRKTRAPLLLLAAAIFFLLVSFGHLTPLRGWLNLIPGMSHFRHPGVLRVFFIMAFILYTGYSLRGYGLSELLKPATPERKTLLYSLAALGSLFLVVLIFHLNFFAGTRNGSFSESIRQAGDGQLILWNSILQLFFVAALIFSAIKKQKWFPLLVMAELVINFLACTPYFAVSSRTVTDVNSLFQYKKGFPVQQASPYSIPAEIRTETVTTWRNTNTYRKEVSNHVSMPGPLILEHVVQFISAPGFQKMEGKQLAFLRDSAARTDSVNIIEQKPGKVKLNLRLARANEIILQQAYFPGWRAFYNGREVPLSKNEFPFVSAAIPAGEGELVFRFAKKPAVYSALLLHFIVLVSMLMVMMRKIFFRYSSLS